MKSRYITCLYWEITDLLVLCEFQVYQRLQRLNLTLSHMSLLRLLSEMGANYDVFVVEWCKSLKSNLQGSKVSQSFFIVNFAVTK